MSEGIVGAAVIVLLLLAVFIGGADARQSWSGYSFDGNGLPEWPNNGTVWASEYDSWDDLPGVGSGVDSPEYFCNNHPTYFKACGSGYVVDNAPPPASGFDGNTRGKVTFTPYPGSHHLFRVTHATSTTYRSGSYSNMVNYGTVGAYARVFNWAGAACDATVVVHISSVPITTYTVSGSTGCVDEVILYQNLNGTYRQINYTTLTTPGSYSFDIFDDCSYRLTFDGAYYDFDCDGGNVVFDYDVCTWVYGHICGIDTVVLRDGNSQLVETVYQGSAYDVYEMPIVDGEDYTISFYDRGSILCYNQTFACTGDHVHIDYDRCEWVYPPSLWQDPIIIYLCAGYDYNIVLFRDEHGNFIENSQLAIYDKTDDKYLQRWTDNKEGYTLLGARFATDHDVLLTLRTFDGVFTLDTGYPANGSALVGEENITTTNWTIPIWYNLRVFPVDTQQKPLFDVFCGLSEYTPLSPQAFWGMDLGRRGYVAVTNCSGFAMCDLVAEKGGYEPYNATALNWTSRSALIKDYRHTAVLEKEWG